MLCANDSFLNCLSSVGSLGQLIPRSFFGERVHACVSSAVIFETITHAPGMVKTKSPGKTQESVYTNVNLGTVPRLPVPGLPPGGSLGTPNILGTGATFHLGPLRLHVQNLESCAQKWSARCQKCAVPCCGFFCACKWG